MPQIGIAEVLLAIITLITGGMLPWAFKMERRLSSIEAKLTNGLLATLNSLNERMNKKSDEFGDFVRDDYGNLKQNLSDRVKGLEGVVARKILPEADRRLRIVEEDVHEIKIKVDMVVRKLESDKE